MSVTARSVPATANSTPTPAVRCPNRHCDKALVWGQPAGLFTLTCPRCKTRVEVRGALAAPERLAS